MRPGTVRTHALRSALLLALALPRLAGAQIVDIDETRSLRSDASVDFGVVTHSVTVHGWDRNEIRVTGRYDSAIDEMTIRGTDAALTFEIERKSGVRNFFGPRGGRSFTLDVYMPRGVRLAIAGVSGDLTIDGLRGSVTAGTVSGTSTITGDLADVSISAVSGGANYDGNAQSVRLEAVSGSVEFRGRTRDLRAEAVSGSVVVDGEAETIEASTVSGSLQLTSAVPVRALDAGSVSGSVRFRGRLAPNSRVSVESHSGLVELAFDAPPDARFELSSFSGGVSAQLAGMRDEVASPARRRGPSSRTVTFVTGAGSGRVTATSFSGSVRVLDAARPDR